MNPTVGVAATFLMYLGILVLIAIALKFGRRQREEEDWKINIDRTSLDDDPDRREEILKRRYWK